MLVRSIEFNRVINIFLLFVLALFYRFLFSPAEIRIEDVLLTVVLK